MTGAATGAAACGEDDDRRLRGALETWRRAQTEQRLAVLGRHGGGSGPPSEEVDGYSELIAVRSPRPGDRLRWGSSGGQVVFEWTGVEPSGPSSSGEQTYWIEYRLGAPPLLIRGNFQVAQRRIVFGPVPQGFWNDVASYSPAHIRVADPENRQRSPWIEFEVLPIE